MNKNGSMESNSLIRYNFKINSEETLLTILRYMKKAILCLCIIYCSFIIFFSFPFLSFAERGILKWGDIELHKAEGTVLEKAKKNLLHFELITAEKDIPFNNIRLACQRNNKVIVWYGNGRTSMAYLCIYNLEGKYEYGYKVQFSIGGGACLLNVDEYGLYIYMSSVNCVYMFNGDLTNYYYVHPKLKGDMIYEIYKMELYGNSKVSYTERRVTVTKDWQSITIVDIPELSEKTIPLFKDTVLWLTILGTSLVAYIIMRK